MKIAKLAMLLAVPLAAPAFAQPAPPATPRPCVIMPRQGAPVQPTPGRPRDRCIPAGFPRTERVGR